MKKILKVIFLFSLIFIFVGCNGSKGEKTFVLEEQGMIAKEIVDYKGNEIVKLKYETTIPYTVMDKKNAEELLEELVTKYSSIEGISSNKKLNDDNSVIKVEIDYSKADFKKFKEKNELIGLFILGETDEDFPKDLKEFEKTMKDSGFVEE